MDKGIEGAYDAKREKFTIADAAWQVIGGGKFDRDENKKTIKFYDNSMAYGRLDATGMKEALQAMPEFSGYTILLE